MLGEEEHSDEEGSFSMASIPKRIAIVLAGAIVNIIFGLLVYFVLSASTGNYISTKIESVIPNYPAEKYGIQAGDKIIKIDDKKIRLRSDIDKVLQNSNGEEIKLTIKRNEEIIEINILPTEEELEGVKTYKLGVAFAIAENSFSNNIYYGFWDTAEFSTSIVDSLRMLFTGNIGVDQLTRTSRNIWNCIKD